MLSLQAAALGWLHYERGEHEQALAYFEDAHWVFREGEYLYLIGLAHERLGARERAAAAYERFIRERPYAPEVETLQVKIQQLRTDHILGHAQIEAEIAAHRG
jgi:tetratricopeptide (TPR) repeat protein